MSASRGVEFVFAVGHRFTCTLTLPARAPHGGVALASVEWAPRVPRKLSARELAEYEAGRNRAIAEWMRMQGHEAELHELDEAQADARGLQ